MEIEAADVQSKVSRGLDFEKHARDTFRKIGFKKVDGGQGFKIGGHQIDAVAGFDNHLLIIECIWSQERTAKQRIRDEIYAFSGKFPEIQLGLKSVAGYSQYKNLHFIIITNATITDELITKASENGITLWNYNVIEYYENLWNYVGNYAFYNLLGELKIKPEGKPVIIPCFYRIHDKYRTYLFFISAKLLLERTFVARRELGRDEYYQRTLNPSRIDVIAKYVDQEDGFFPNDVIVAFNTEEERPRFIKSHMKPPSEREYKFSNDYTFPYGMQPGFLLFPQSYRACAVIDGQHRLFSFAKSNKDLMIPVFALDDTSYEDQSKIFIDINGKQKKVDPNLVWELQASFRKDSVEGRIATTVIKLNDYDPQNSPFKGKIRTYLKNSSGSFNLAEICGLLKKLKLIEKQTASGNTHNPLYDHITDQNTDKAAKGICNYFAEIQIIFPKDFFDGFVFRKNGLLIFLEILERLISVTQRPVNKKDVETYLKPLVEYTKSKYSSIKDIQELDGYCNTFENRNKTYKEFGKVIKSQNSEFDPRLVMLPLDAKIAPFERKLSKFIYESFIKDKQIEVPLDEDRKINARLKPNEVYHERMSLGLCIHLIRNNPSQFDKIFISSQFPNRNLYLGALDFVNTVKIDSSSHNQKPYNEELVENYINELIQIIGFSKIT